MRISDWSSDVCSSDLQRRALVEAVERGPIPAVHGVVRWRLIDLVQWLHEEFAVSLDETTVGRELKKLGYVKLTARLRHHSQNEHAMEAFKKGALPPSWQRSEEHTSELQSLMRSSYAVFCLKHKTHSPCVRHNNRYTSTPPL